jgi:membrane-associated phospholipid phosphatase
LKTIAKAISTFGNPICIALFYGFYIQFFIRNSQEFNYLPILFTLFIVGPTILFIYIKVKNNEFSDFDVSNRVKRNSLYKFLLPLLCFLTIVLIFFRFPPKVIFVTSAILLQIFVAKVLNKSIKVSMHTSFCFLFANLFYPLNPIISIILFVFGFLILWSRIYLNRHSPKEVWTGFLLGNSIGYIYLTLVHYFLR